MGWGGLFLLCRWVASRSRWVNRELVCRHSGFPTRVWAIFLMDKLPMSNSMSPDTNTTENSEVGTSVSRWCFQLKKIRFSACRSSMCKSVMLVINVFIIYVGFWSVFYLVTAYLCLQFRALMQLATYNHSFTLLANHNRSTLQNSAYQPLSKHIWHLIIHTIAWSLMWMNNSLGSTLHMD